MPLPPISQNRTVTPSEGKSKESSGRRSSDPSMKHRSNFCETDGGQSVIRERARQTAPNQASFAARRVSSHQNNFLHRLRSEGRPPHSDRLISPRFVSSPTFETKKKAARCEEVHIGLRTCSRKKNNVLDGKTLWSQSVLMVHVFLDLPKIRSKMARTSNDSNLAVLQVGLPAAMAEHSKGRMLLPSR